MYSQTTPWYAMCQVRISFFQPKLGQIWNFFPFRSQKIQTVLQPSASGQSGFFGLLQERISRLVLPSAGRMLQTHGADHLIVSNTLVSNVHPHHMVSLCFDQNLALVCYVSS